MSYEFHPEALEEYEEVAFSERAYSGRERRSRGPALQNDVRDRFLLRTEPATNNVADSGIKKAVAHLPELRHKLSSIVDNYLNVQ